MRRIRRLVFGVLASTSRLAGAGGAALAAVTTITPTGAVVALAPHPTAVEYAATAIEH
jgi:hypothetical protein